MLHLLFHNLHNRWLEWLRTYDDHYTDDPHYTMLMQLRRLK